jgi:hypothetical protein
LNIPLPFLNALENTNEKGSSTISNEILAEFFSWRVVPLIPFQEPLVSQPLVLVVIPFSPVKNTMLISLPSVSSDPLIGYGTGSWIHIGPDILLPFLKSFKV